MAKNICYICDKKQSKKEKGHYTTAYWYHPKNSMSDIIEVWICDRCKNRRLKNKQTLLDR